jgi:chemotaxis protein MotB
MSRRRHQHEDHVNHEAWAIPYGDLITLLLAFFVVMYAISSVNEGKYRVLSDALNAAFRGAPRSMEPIQIGDKTRGQGAGQDSSMIDSAMLHGQPRQLVAPVALNITDTAVATAGVQKDPTATRHDPVAAAHEDSVRELSKVAAHVEEALRDLVAQNVVAVRRHATWVEVEIRTDILFPSGVAKLSPSAEEVINKLANTLKPFPNPIRVEGHTDNRPISTVQFPSNWELSAARAGSVVHLFTNAGVDPTRLAVVGLGEFRPAQSNDTVEGRNANRRVLFVILNADEKLPEGGYAQDRGHEEVAADPQPEPATTEGAAAATPGAVVESAPAGT